ncbi:MAG: DnaJ domain-containing protein [Thermoanaerobaculia bacterium]|nr:DnaJ domain-containing protein [Thermoanaerobaculia bacterium]
MRANYYEVLGVDRTASESEIRDRFRKLARESHPDRYRGPDKADAERKFQLLTEAMNVLTNPQRRKAHDTELSAGVSFRPPSDPREVAKLYVANGVRAYKAGDFPVAIENFDMAVKHNPEDAKAFHYLALAAARVPSMVRQAVQAVETAVQKEPYNPGFLKDAGILCRKVGLFAKAERYFEEALKWDRGNSEIEAALAEVRQARAKK